MCIRDRHMPEVTGMDVLAHVLARHPRLPFIVLSGDEDLDLSLIHISEPTRPY